jgi:hypothetical protein
MPNTFKIDTPAQDCFYPIADLNDSDLGTVRKAHEVVHTRDAYPRVYAYGGHAGVSRSYSVGGVHAGVSRSYSVGGVHNKRQNNYNMDMYMLANSVGDVHNKSQHTYDMDMLGGVRDKIHAIHDVDIHETHNMGLQMQRHTQSRNVEVKTQTQTGADLATYYADMRAPCLDSGGYIQHGIMTQTEAACSHAGFKTHTEADLGILTRAVDVNSSLSMHMGDADWRGPDARILWETEAGLEVCGLDLMGEANWRGLGGSRDGVRNNRNVEVRLFDECKHHDTDVHSNNNCSSSSSSNGKIETSTWLDMYSNNGTGSNNNGKIETSTRGENGRSNNNIDISLLREYKQHERGLYGSSTKDDIHKDAEISMFDQCKTRDVNIFSSGSSSSNSIRRNIHTYDNNKDTETSLLTEQEQQDGDKCNNASSNGKEKRLFRVRVHDASGSGEDMHYAIGSAALYEEDRGNDTVHANDRGNDTVHANIISTGAPSRRLSEAAQVRDVNLKLRDRFKVDI